MIRGIIRRHIKYRHNGLVTAELETFDFEAPELERVLTDGGYAEDGYDYRELLGVEILPQGGSGK